MSFWDCGTCGIRKPLDQFHRNRTSKRGHRLHCKDCENARAAAYREANPDYARLASKRWREKNHERYVGHNRTAQIRKHSLTPERFDAMLASQGGRCAACRADGPGAGRSWNIDHDHACCPGAYSCGECIRGLLCVTCNIALGGAKDDIRILNALVAYLAKGA